MVAVLPSMTFSMFSTIAFVVDANSAAESGWLRSPAVR